MKKETDQIDMNNICEEALKVLGVTNGEAVNAIMEASENDLRKIITFMFMRMSLHEKDIVKIFDSI